jgi:septal ring factor EnvC (AmiA/AmiB activator)
VHARLLTRSKCRLGLLLLLALPAAAGAWPVAAQEADQTSSIETRRQSGLEEYERVTREITLTDEKLARLAADIATVKKDSVTLTAALIQSAKTEKKLSEDITEIEQRLVTLKEQEASARLSLIAQQDVMADVLGALERMGLNPPPALLVRPEDALSSVRSAILLGAVVPEMRAKTDLLLADLQKISRLTASIAAERDSLAEAVSQQAIARKRLEILVEEKRKLRHDSEASLIEERKKAAELASQATSLKGLLAALEKEAQKAPPPAAVQPPEAPAGQVAMPLPDINMLLGPQSFDTLQGQIATPVSGSFVKRFGKPDGNGGVMLGDTVATQSDAIVTAPADGNVLYAGPFRSYGQLLILNVGGGYHVVLAGMNRINVSPGQAVLAGEPVGAMGDAKVASAAGSAIGTAGRELYIEFRKDGKPVDPAPWWARRLSGRTGNDT